MLSVCVNVKAGRFTSAETGFEVQHFGQDEVFPRVILIPLTTTWPRSMLSQGTRDRLLDAVPHVHACMQGQYNGEVK